MQYITSTCPSPAAGAYSTRNSQSVVYTRTKQATLLKPTSSTTGLQGWLTERREDKGRREEGEEERKERGGGGVERRGVERRGVERR